MALVADLPAVAADPATGVSAPVTTRRIAAVLGNVEQSNSGVIPSRLELRAVAGNLELDLTGARFAPGVTEISIRAFMGNVEIQLPAWRWRTSAPASSAASSAMDCLGRASGPRGLHPSCG
jgi:hypothetical protein